MNESRGENWYEMANELEAEIVAELSEVEMLTPLVVMTRDTRFYTFNMRWGKMCEYLRPHIELYKRCQTRRASFVVLDDACFNSESMSRLLRWLRKYTKRSLRHEPITEILSEWDKRFFNMDFEILCNMIMVAYKLQLSKLLVLAIQAVGFFMAHKTFDEVMLIFTVANEISMTQPAFSIWLAQYGALLHKLYCVHYVAHEEHERRVAVGEPHAYHLENLERLGEETDDEEEEDDDDTDSDSDSDEENDDDGMGGELVMEMEIEPENNDEPMANWNNNHNHLQVQCTSLILITTVSILLLTHVPILFMFISLDTYYWCNLNIQKNKKIS